MQKHEKMLVALDLSATDEYLMVAARELSGVLGVKTVYFMHIVPDFTEPKAADLSFHTKFAPDEPVDELVKKKIESSVASIFGTVVEEVKVEVKEGKPYRKLLHWMEVKDASFLVVGNKAHSQGSGVTAQRVARSVKADVLLVPDRAPKAVKNIMVPIDFSPYSAKAIEAAAHWKNRNPDLVVDLIYIIDLPPVDYYIQTSRQSGLSGVLKESAQEAFGRFVEEYQVDQRMFNIHYVDNHYSNTALHLKEFAETRGADMVIMGAQGHGAIERFIFGSVTEKFIATSKEQLIWIVR